MDCSLKGKFSQEILEIIKDYTSNEVIPQYLSLQEEKDEDKVTLYHGTSAAFLKEILTKGLLPRKFTDNNNFENENPSNENLVYLTNRWQYIYAANANLTRLQQWEHYDENEGLEEQQTAYWEETGDVPIVLKISVPVSWLVPDEDIAFNRAFKQKIREGTIRTVSDITYQDSLAQYTVASKKPIPLEYIEQIEVAAYFDQSVFLEENSEYVMAFSLWCRGFANFTEEDLEGFVEMLKDYNTGGFDEIDMSRIKHEQPIIRYEKDSNCVFVEYNKTPKLKSSL